MKEMLKLLSPLVVCYGRLLLAVTMILVFINLLTYPWGPEYGIGRKQERIKENER